MKKHLIFAIAIISLVSFTPVYANQYLTFYTGSDAVFWQQYYGPGYSLKEQQEKSDLEYRLKSLETQIQGDPNLSIMQIDSRISELQTQKIQEVNVMRDTYANHGIVNQFDAKQAEIDAKYQSQINSLQQQKTYYQNILESSKKTQQEVEDIKKQIQDINNNLSSQTDNSTQINTYIGRIPTAQEMFDYLDSLSLHDASVNFQKLESINPDLSKQTLELYKKKYPNGKEGTALNDDYKNSLAPSVGVADQYAPDKILTEVKSASKKENKKAFFDDLSVSTTSTTTTQSATTTHPIAEPPKEGFVTKVFKFFRSLIFWR